MTKDTKRKHFPIPKTMLGWWIKSKHFNEIAICTD